MAPSTSSSSSPSSSPHPSIAVDASCRRSVAHDVEAELRIICLESRKKYSQIKEHSERVIAKLIASDGDVPVEEVLAVIIVASETHNPRLLLPCLGCIQRLIMGQLVNTPKRLTTVVTYLHDRANDTDPTVQVKALQTILLLLTPPFAPLLTNSELLMRQLLSACVILLNSESSLVRHTAVACLRQVADFLLDGADKAYHSLSEKDLENLGSSGRNGGRSKGQSASLMVEAMPVPDRLPSGPLRLLFLFVHDLCLISLGRASRCKWLGELAISRTLALELIESAVAVEADVFASLPDFTELAREVVVPTVESTIAVCQYDFKVLIRALRIVYRLCSYPPLCLKLAREICGDSSAPGEQSLHGPSRGLVPLMLRQLLLRHDRPLWARSAVLETFKKILQSDDSSSGFLNTLFLGSSSSSSALSSSPLDDTVAASDDGSSSSSPAASTGRDVHIDPKSNRFVELVNSLSHVLHHLWFASVPTQPDTSDGSMRMFGLYDADPSQAATGSDLLALGVAHVFAGEGGVSLLDCLADSEPPTSVNPSFGAALAAETILLLVEHIKSCDMLACSWAPLLSSLSLLLSVRLPQSHSEGGGETVRHADDEEAFDVFLQSVLNALERLLLGCAKFPQLSSGRDSCLEALAKESLPRKGAQELDSHTATCAKGLLNICHRSGERLSVPGWTLALRTFETLYLRFINAQQQQSGATISDSGLECQVLAVSMDSLFSTPPDADGSFVDMVDALVHRDTCWALERLAMALASADSRRLDLVLDTIVSPALRTSRHPEEAAICAGKVLMGHINRQGCCPRSLIAPLKSFTTSAPETVVSILKDLMVRSPVATELDAAGWVSLSELIRDLCDVPTAVGASRASSTGKRSSQLMTNQLHSSVYSTLEALVMDCIDVLPNASVALIIDGLQRLSTNSVINTSLKALALLWNVSDALLRRMSGQDGGVSDHSRRHYSVGSTTTDGTPAAPAVQPATFDPQESGRLWFDLLTKFQSVSLDPRPSVRHCAIRTMVSMLTAACGCPGVDAPSAVGLICDTLSEVVQASTAPSTVDVRPEDSSGRGSYEGLIVHHSRDSVQKQWNETCVLVLEGSVSVISKYHSCMTPQELDNPTAEILTFIRSHLDGQDGEVHDACANALVELLRLGADEKDGKLWSNGWQLVAYVADTLVEEPVLSEETGVSLPLSLAELVKDPQCLAAFRSDDVIVLALLVMATITRPSTYLQSALPFKDFWVPTTLSDTNQQRGRSISVGDGVSAGLHEVASRGRCAQLLWGKAESSPSQDARYRRLPETVKSPVVEARLDGDCSDECHQPTATEAIVFSRTTQRLPHKFMELWSVLDLLLATSDLPEASLEVLVQLLCNGFLDVNFCLRDSLTAALAVRAGSTCELIATKLAPSSKVKSAVLMFVTSAALDLMRTYYAGGTGGGQSWKASGLWELAAEMLSTVLDQLNTLGGITDDERSFWSDGVEEVCKYLPSVLQIHYRYCQPPRGVSTPADGKKEDNNNNNNNKPDWATVSAVAVLIALCRSNFANPTTVVGLTSKLCDARTRSSGDLGRCALRVLFAVAIPHGMLWSPEDARARSIMIADRWVGHRYSGDGRSAAASSASPASADGEVRDAGKDIGPPLRRLATSELCRRVCCTLSQYAEDEASTPDKPMVRPRTDQVLFLLNRLCDAADEQLLLATLPALSKLVANTREEEEVRRAASQVMLSLADVLGSKAAYNRLVGADFVVDTPTAMSHPGNPSAGDGGGGSGCPPHATAAPTIENYMRGSDWRGKWRKAATPVHIEPRKPFASHSQHGGIAAERPNSGGPVIIDWRKSAAPGTTPPKRPRPWSGEPQWHSNHAKGHHVKGHHHQGPWEGDWHQQQQQQQQRDPGWNEGGEPWQGDRNWEGGRWWNWKANPAGPGGTWHEDSGSKEQQWSANDGWNQQDQYHRGSQGSWGGEGPWEEGKWQAADQQQQQPVEQQGGAPPLGGDVKTQHDASQEQGSEEPSTKKARGASKSPDGQPGSTIFVNALRKLFQAKNAAAAKAPAKTATNTDNNNPALWEEGKAPEKPLGGGALTALLSKQATLSAAKAPSPVPSPGSPSNGQSDTELRKNVLTRLLASENAGDLLQDPKVVEMLLQVASQLDESGLSDLQKSVVKIITKLQSSSSPTAAATTLPPDQLAKRGACVERLKAILEGLRGLFLERQEKRISQASKTAAATAKLSSSTPSHSHLASLLSGVSAQNQPIYDHKVWTGHVQRSGVNKAKVNLYATLPVNSLTTALVAQLGNELNLKLRVPDTEVLHQRQNHAESSALVLMKADSAADQAELNAQIAYFNGRSRSGVAKFERDGEHYAVFMIPPGQLAEKLIGSDNYKRCNPDDMATVCMITKSDTSTATH